MYQDNKEDRYNSTCQTSVLLALQGAFGLQHEVTHLPVQDLWWPAWARGRRACYSSIFHTSWQADDWDWCTLLGTSFHQAQ